MASYDILHVLFMLRIMYSTHHNSYTPNDLWYALHALHAASFLCYPLDHTYIHCSH